MAEEPQALKELKKQTEKFEKDNVSGLASKLQGMFMSDSQVAKKIISLKAPNMKDDELNLLVYGRDLKKELGASYKAWKSEREKEKEIEEEEKKEPKTKKEKRKKEKKVFKPLPKDSPVYDEVKKVKTEIKNKILMWEKKGVALGKEVVKFGTLVGSTFAAAPIMVAPVSFNVPGAITLITNLLNGLDSLSQKILDFVPLISVIDLFRLVLPDEEIDKITKPMLGFVQAVIKTSQIINTLKGALPKVDEAALEQAKKQQEEIDKRIKNLKRTDFPEGASGDKEFEKTKKKLEDKKEEIGKKASKAFG
jgi:hypothetical protein